MQSSIFCKPLESKKINRKIYYFPYLTLGKGSFGFVYYGVMKENNSCPYKMVAVKMIDSEINISELNKEDQEIANLTLLEDIQGVVKIHEVIEEREKNIHNPDRVFVKKYLILEFGNRGTLEDFVKKNNLSDLEIRHVFKKLVYALKGMHDHKVMHRDIKPTNVIFADEFAKFVDFGQSKELTQENELAKTKTGTDNYINPQILQGTKYNFKGDVFSLGVTLYFMYYRRLPFYRTKEGEQNPKAKTEHQFLKLYKSTLKESKIDEIFTNEAYIDEKGKELIKKMLDMDENARICLEEIINHKYMKFEKSGISSPKKVKLVIPKKITGLDKEMRLAFKVESNKQIAMKITNRLQFERNKALFINKLLSNFVKLGPLFPAQLFSNLVVSLAYVNYLHISVFYNVIEAKEKPTRLAKKWKWKIFYESEEKNENGAIKNLEPALKIIQKNYQDMCAAAKLEFLTKEYQKLLKFDKNINLDIFRLLQKAVIEIIREMMPKIDLISEKESSDFVVKTLYDFLLVITMGSSLSFAKVGKFINFERYREMKTISENSEIMKQRLNLFVEKIVPQFCGKKSHK